MKTFSGLMKIIYPDKKASCQEIEELLKFAMEGRKRVKDQILRIDSTLPQVDFSYISNSGVEVKVKTTEEIQYKGLYNGEMEDSEDEVMISSPEVVEVINDSSKETATNEEEIKEHHFVIEENQIGVTFEKLFGRLFKGVKNIVITDPYIRNFYQTVNLMELLEVVDKAKSETDIVTVELITSADEFNEQIQRENLNTIRESCLQMGIEFSYQFDSSIHARSIVTDTGWKVLLDRGLDIFQNCERKDAFQFTTRLQKYRPCKKFEITYLRT